MGLMAARAQPRPTTVPATLRRRRWHGTTWPAMPSAALHRAPERGRAAAEQRPAEQMLVGCLCLVFLRGSEGSVEK